MEPSEANHETTTTATAVTVGVITGSEPDPDAAMTTPIVISEDSSTVLPIHQVADGTSAAGGGAAAHLVVDGIPPMDKSKKKKNDAPAFALNKWNVFGKFRAVFMKNLARQKRQYKSNLCQIIFPLLLVGFSGGINVLFLALFKWIIIIPVIPDVEPVFYSTPESGIATTLSNDFYPMCYNSTLGYDEFYWTENALTSYFKIFVVKDGTLDQNLGTLNSDGTKSGLFADMHQFNYSRTIMLQQNGNFKFVYPNCELTKLQIPFMTDVTSLKPSSDSTIPVAEWLDELLYSNITSMSSYSGTCDSTDNALQHCIDLSHTVPTSAIIIHEYSLTKLSYTIQTTSSADTIPSDSFKTNFGDVKLDSGAHSMALANILNAAFTQRHIDATVGNELAYSVVDKQYPKFAFGLIDQLLFPNLIAMVLFSVAVTFLLPQYMYEITYERSLGLTEIAKLMGLDRKLEWCARFLFDYLIYFGILAFMVVLSAILQLGIFLRTNPLWWILLFFVWGHAQIALAYFFAAFFSNPRTATVVGYLAVLVNAVGGWIINLVFLRTSEITLSTAWLYLYPPISFFRGMGLITLALVDTSDVVPPWFDYEIILQIGIMAVSTVVLHILAAYFELVIPRGFGIAKNPLFFITDPIRNIIRGFQRKARTAQKQHKSRNPEVEMQQPQEQQQPTSTEMAVEAQMISISAISQDDHAQPDRDMTVLQEKVAGDEGAEKEEEEEEEEEDVVAERESILEGLHAGDLDYEQQIVIINNMMKYWRIRTHKKYALKGVTLGIRSNECFGLLGPNGAGKTTLIKCLSGLDKPSSGNAIIGGLDLRHDLEHVYHLIGICPQFDVLYPDLTVEEHLLFYSRLKGVPWKHERRHVEAVIDEVGLSEARRRFARNLSGGMKRRLSIAIALTGAPKVVLLDEPTTGLDPASKQAVWEVIEKAKSKKRCIVLTTHNMEEAESLCDRIGIMVAGKLRCLGSPQRLKSKYGEGFRIVLSCNPDAMTSDSNARVEKLMKSLVPLAMLEGAFPNGTFVYRVQHSEDLQLSTFFPSMEKLKYSYGITDWALSQASLEEVFLGLVSRFVSAADAE